MSQIRCGIALVCVLQSTLVLGTESEQPIIGETECVYTLAQENTEVRGLAWDESSHEQPRLLVLDRSGTVFAYELGGDGELDLAETLSLYGRVGPTKLVSPRGLAFAVEDGQPIIYFMDGSPAGARLFRHDLDNGDVASVDLSLHTFRIGDREVYDLACDDGALLVSYDASGHADPNRRVQRGILRIKWDGSLSADPEVVQHLPDAGTAPSRGLAIMQLGGASYLWATIDSDLIYCADLLTGRGLFFFDRPKSPVEGKPCWGLCFGQDDLWVSENVPGADRIHRVNVTKNLEAPLVGPRVPRKLIMTIRTDPETKDNDPGAVYHHYSRPFANAVMPNQGIWLETEKITDLSELDNATIQEFAQDPGGDSSSRQILHRVAYSSSPGRSYSSRYEIDVWTNPYKKFVYPHLVNRDKGALDGTDYLADDPLLYNLNDATTYEAFINRVRSHIHGKYGTQADMQNPYWAARNVVEYLQDNYYYPNREKRMPATVDYDRKHYDANPANLKIELSNKPYDKTQIIACSGTSVMVAGAMRHLGVPARWLGTGTQRGPSDWDANGNGLLDSNETAACTNGHRYTQVWLGSRYGWICFDATPSKPAFNDYDVPPPLQSEFRYMTRAASGHREPRRIVFNVGSERIEALYRAFEYDERLAIDNNCGGDQRYNLQGQFEKPGLWKSPRHGIQVQNICFLTGVCLQQSERDSTVTWQLEGAWDRIPEATVSLHLRRREPSGGWRDVAPLAAGVHADDCAATVDLSSHGSGSYRIILRRDGDPETGGVSEVFDLK